MKPRHLWLALSALGFAVYVHREMSQADPPSPAMRDAARPARAPVPPRLPQPARSEPPSNPALPPNQAQFDDPAPDPERVVAPTAEEEREQLEDSFEADRPDRVSTDRGRHLEATVTAALPDGSSVNSVACKRTLCRVETVHRDIAAFQEFVQRGFMRPTVRMTTGAAYVSVLAEPVAGQPVVTVAFLARDGEALPPTMPDDPSGHP